jgi:hypothetical protein
MTRIQADAILDLSEWARHDVTHATRGEAEEAAIVDANDIDGKVVYVRDCAFCGQDDSRFDPPLRAKVYDTDPIRWMDNENCDPVVDFVFLDHAPSIPADKDGKQRGWWFNRTHRVSS